MVGRRAGGGELGARDAVVTRRLPARAGGPAHLLSRRPHEGARLCDLANDPGEQVHDVVTDYEVWPPHAHDVDAMPGEAVLEETYYYQVNGPEGWGVARIYFRDSRPGRPWAVRNGDLLLATEGYNPFSANPA